jgi:hypothetical protein
VGSNLAFGEFAHAFFELKLFLVELEIQASSATLRYKLAVRDSRRNDLAPNFLLEHS